MLIAFNLASFHCGFLDCEWFFVGERVVMHTYRFYKQLVIFYESAYEYCLKLIVIDLLSLATPLGLHK